MRQRIHIFALRLALAVVSLPLFCTSATTWHLEALRCRLQTKLSNLEANAPR